MTYGGWTLKVFLAPKKSSLDQVFLALPSSKVWWQLTHVSITDRHYLSFSPDWLFIPCTLRPISSSDWMSITIGHPPSRSNERCRQDMCCREGVLPCLWARSRFLVWPEPMVFVDKLRCWLTRRDGTERSTTVFSWISWSAFVVTILFPATSWMMERWFFSKFWSVPQGGTNTVAAAASKRWNFWDRVRQIAKLMACSVRQVFCKNFSWPLAEPGFIWILSWGRAISLVWCIDRSISRSVSWAQHLRNPSSHDIFKLFRPSGGLQCFYGHSPIKRESKAYFSWIEFSERPLAWSAIRQAVGLKKISKRFQACTSPLQSISDYLGWKTASGLQIAIFHCCVFPYANHRYRGRVALSEALVEESRFLWSSSHHHPGLRQPKVIVRMSARSIRKRCYSTAFMALFCTSATCVGEKF